MWIISLLLIHSAGEQSFDKWLTYLTNLACFEYLVVPYLSVGALNIIESYSQKYLINSCAFFVIFPQPVHVTQCAEQQ